jgi:hypothetical protein
LLDPSPTTSAGVGKAPSRVIRSPPARAGRGAAVAEPALVPGVRLAAGWFAAASGGPCTDKAAESGQHTITKITAKTKAVNPSHRTSAASFGRLAPITGTALVAIIYPFVIVPAEIRYGLFVKLNRGSHRERRHWLLTSF